MRPVLAIQVCIALFQAFLVAPVQHVHDVPDGTAEGHEHSTVIHWHFSPHRGAIRGAGGPAFTDDDGRAAWPLDTFTVELPMDIHAPVPSVSPESVEAPRLVLWSVATVEERAHDPPARASVIPRAPPA